jgi:hypothetical protein
VVRSFRSGDSLSPVLISEVCFTRICKVFATLSTSLTRSISPLDAVAVGYVGTNWELDFKQCSFHHIMQVLRVYDFSVFSSPPALPPCSCSLAFRHQVRWLTSRISSESYPGDQECVANCHGAEEFTYVHHAIHPAPSPPDAGRDTAASRLWCQSGDCGCLVRGHSTARYLAALPRRILLMEQQVWSIQLAPAKEAGLLPSPRLRTGRESFPSSGSSIPKAV